MIQQRKNLGPKGSRFFQKFGVIGRQNHGRPWACEREGPVLKKMLWKVGVYSCLPERLIGDGRDSAKRVVSDTDTPKSSLLHFTYAVR